MSKIEVRKSKREQLIGSIAVFGPSGSGKTVASLTLAYGMMKEKHPDLEDEQVWSKIGIIDTEHRRSMIYTDSDVGGLDIGSFLHVDLQAPYTVERYVQSALALKDAGAEVLIIDSTSHAWESDGGLLDLQQERGGNYQAWREVNPVYNNFIRLITGDGTGIHTISTIRSKQKHEMSYNEQGKLEVVKLGLQPVQRDSMEYELHVSLALDMSHKFTASKDNTGLFTGRSDYVTEEYGRKLYKFLEMGVNVKEEELRVRREKLAYINTLRENNEQIDFKANDFEAKTKMTLEAMIEDKPLWFDSAYNQLDRLANELSKKQG